MIEPDYKGFANAIYNDWPDCGSLDGFDLQELGEKYGLLVPEERTTLCDPECNCAEYYSSDEITAGFTCYRWNGSRNGGGQGT